MATNPKAGRSRQKPSHAEQSVPYASPPYRLSTAPSMASRMSANGKWNRRTTTRWRCITANGMGQNSCAICGPDPNRAGGSSLGLIAAAID